MTNHYERVEVTIVRDELINTTCDRCGNEIPDTKRPNTREFTLVFTEGTWLPEYGSSTGWEVADLCDACVEVLKDLLINNGFTISEVDRDW